jgi:hypothetical protein
MAATPRDPPQSVASKDQLKALLLAGLDSGDPRTVTAQDWEVLRRRALVAAQRTPVSQ